MHKKIFTIVAASFLIVTVGTGLMAQDKKPEKLMIYDGEEWKVQFYGFVKIDFVYNSSNVRNESGPFFVENNAIVTANRPWDPFGLLANATYPNTPTLAFPKPPAQTRGSFVVDPRSSRLGFKVMGPEFLKAKTMAMVEADFWGDTVASGTPIRQGHFRMRHAMIKMTWDSFEYVQGYLMFGNYWSLFMSWPVAPDTVTFIPFAFMGMPFMREPQLTGGIGFGPDKFKVWLEGSGVRAMGGEDNSDLVFTGANASQIDNAGTGEASKSFGANAKVRFEGSITDDIKFWLGASMHYHKEKHTLSFETASRPHFSALPAEVTVGSTTIYPLKQLVAKTAPSRGYQAWAKMQVYFVSLAAAVFTGENLNQYLCGLGQGVVENAYGNSFLAVKTRGGWGQLHVDLRQFKVPVTASVSYGGEWKNDRLYVQDGVISWNKIVMGNMWVYLNSNLRIGLEIGEIQTKYKGVLGHSEDLKVHGATQISF